jgi:predicted outer membrane protein
MTMTMTMMMKTATLVVLFAAAAAVVSGFGPGGRTGRVIAKAERCYADNLLQEDAGVEAAKCFFEINTNTEALLTEEACNNAATNSTLLRDLLARQEWGLGILACWII